MLRSIPEVATISFRQITFWGGFDYIADGWYLRRGPATCHRVFKWDKGFEYVSHRPPTVHDNLGRSLRELRWVDDRRSEEHTSELQSLMRISYAVFCLKKKNNNKI